LINIEIRDPFWRSPLTNQKIYFVNRSTWNPIWRFSFTEADIDVVLHDEIYLFIYLFIYYFFKGSSRYSRIKTVILCYHQLSDSFFVHNFVGLH